MSRVWLISWVLRGGSIPQHIPPHSHVLASRQRLTRPACRRPARRSRHIRAVPQPTGVAVQTAAVGPTTWLSTLLSMVSPIPCRGLSPLLNLVMILFRPPRAHRPPGVGGMSGFCEKSDKQWFATSWMWSGSLGSESGPQWKDSMTDRFTSRWIKDLMCQQQSWCFRVIVLSQRSQPRSKLWGRRRC